MKPGLSKLQEIFTAALAAVDPDRIVRSHTADIRDVYEREGHCRLIVTGFGKAAFCMAQAISRELTDLIEAGLIITKYGHSNPEERLERIKVREAGHPVPDASGLAATAEILRLGEMDERTLVVNLISGGGSALLVAPVAGVTLWEKQQVTELLLKAGAEIHEFNAVRKHLSRVKGGCLAVHFAPARILSLILSDVIGDRLDTIASGPTAPDPTTFADAWGILERYRLLRNVPDSVRLTLDRGRRGLLPETPKAGDEGFVRVENRIIGNNRLALAAAQRKAESLGYEVRIISTEQTGEAAAVGKQLATMALLAGQESSPTGKGKLCLLAGGETTVTVRGQGRGGRNMELALSFAAAVSGVEGLVMLSAGTDGTDGPTDAAGAMVDGRTVIRARQMGLEAENYLQQNDTYTFFQQLGELFITGPTGTNVMDIQVVLIG